MLCSRCAHPVLTLCAPCAQAVCTLCSRCAHPVPTACRVCLPLQACSKFNPRLIMLLLKKLDTGLNVLFNFAMRLEAYVETKVTLPL